MHRYTRVVFGFNAFYQTILGFLCLFAPGIIIAMFGGSDADCNSTLMIVTFRLIGANLVPIGIISAVLALSPDTYPILRQLMGLVALLTLMCWGIAISAHDLSLSQVASIILDGIVQLLILVAVVGYSPSCRFRQMVVHRRVAA